MHFYYCFHNYDLIGVYEDKKQMETVVLDYMYNFMKHSQTFKGTFDKFKTKYEKEIQSFKKDRSVAIGETVFTVNYANNDFAKKEGDSLIIPINTTFDFRTKYTKEEKHIVKKNIRSPVHITPKKEIDSGIDDETQSNRKKEKENLKDQKNEEISKINNEKKETRKKLLQSKKCKIIPLIIEGEKHNVYKINPDDMQKILKREDIKPENDIVPRHIKLQEEFDEDIVYIR